MWWVRRQVNQKSLSQFFCSLLSCPDGTTKKISCLWKTFGIRSFCENTFYQCICSNFLFSLVNLVKNWFSVFSMHINQHLISIKIAQFLQLTSRTKIHNDNNSSKNCAIGMWWRLTCTFIIEFWDNFNMFFFNFKFRLSF